MHCGPSSNLAWFPHIFYLFTDPFSASRKYIKNSFALEWVDFGVPDDRCTWNEKKNAFERHVLPLTLAKVAKKPKVGSTATLLQQFPCCIYACGFQFSTVRGLSKTANESTLVILLADGRARHCRVLFYFIF